MRWAECNLFDFGEIVFGVAIQNHTANWDQWELTLWPDLEIPLKYLISFQLLDETCQSTYFGQVERIPFELLGLFKSHHLNFKGPRWKFLLGNGVIQIAGCVIRIIGS